MKKSKLIVLIKECMEEIKLDEKAHSEIQQQAAGAALAAKRGEIPKSELRGASLRMYNDMTEKQLEDFASTKHDTVPHEAPEEAYDPSLNEGSYKEFFNTAMKKFGVSSPKELQGDKEKEFYDYVDKNWKGKKETDEASFAYDASNTSKSIPAPKIDTDSEEYDEKDVDDEIDEEELSPKQKKEMDLDGDGDIGADDLKKLRDKKKETNEAVNPKDFKKGTKVYYGNKQYKVKDITRNYIELEDDKGITKVIDFEDMKSFNSGKLVTESKAFKRIMQLNSFLSED